ncbi:glycosyltransferase family 2 protein [Microbacterium karelineae]|uniref:glycosyltransferase family 2 protein n=1 Tax=Microbacterium karelineae TaxID=2654283 RepID=UPI0012EA0F54|nr:glycosyltransferase [Microbacterium karelineae]
MPHSPELSVVIPAYEQASFLAETMASVLDQTGVDLELIVADHASSDGTYEVAEAFTTDPRVTLLRTPAGGGAASNWAAVTDVARGEFLKLLPGDDTVLPGSLARQAALLRDHPGAALVAGRRRIVDSSGRTIAKRRGLQGLDVTLPGDEAVRRAVVSGTNPFGEPGAVMMRRAVLEAAGGWQGRWSYAIDLASYFGALRHGSFVRDDEVASTFRVGGGQWSVALVDQQADEITRLFEETGRELDAVTPDDVRRGARRARALARQRRIVYRVLGAVRR